MKFSKALKKISHPAATRTIIVRHIVQAMVAVIQRSLRDDKAVRIPGLGTFYTQHQVIKRLPTEAVSTQVGTIATPVFSAEGAMPDGHGIEKPLVDYVLLTGTYSKQPPELVREIIGSHLVKLIHNTISAGGFVQITGLGTFKRRAGASEHPVTFASAIDLREFVDPQAGVRDMLSKAAQGIEPYASHVPLLLSQSEAKQAIRQHNFSQSQVLVAQPS